MYRSERDSDSEPRAGTHPVPVKVLLDLDVLHLAVLSQGESQKAEGHSVAQHTRLEEGEKKESQISQVRSRAEEWTEREGTRERDNSTPSVGVTLL